MTHPGCIFRARSQCSIHKSWGTQSSPEGRVVYLICPTKPADPHFWGFVPHNRHQIIFLYLVVLHPGVTTNNIWTLWMIPVDELSNMWDDSQMVTIESYGRFFFSFFYYPQRLCYISMNTMSKMCHFILRKQGAEIVSIILNISRKWFTHIFILKSRFYSHPLQPIEDFLFQRKCVLLWFMTQYFD